MTLDQRIRDLANSIGADVGVLEDAILAIAGGPLPVSQDSGEQELLHHVQTVTAAGTTTLITPTPNKSLRLRWVYLINDPTASSVPLMTLNLGNDPVFRVWALSKRQLKTGAVNAPLNLNLSSSGNVAVTVIYQEV